MISRNILPVALLTTALAVGGPALAGDPRQQPSDQSSGPSIAESDSPRVSQRVNAQQHRPQHTSDGQRGLIAPALPSVMRSLAGRTSQARWDVAPGVTYTRWTELDPRGPIRAHLLTIDADRPGLKIDYASKGSVRSTAPTKEILAVDRAIAGVNGDFFDIGDTGAPLGLGRDRQRGLVHARQSGWNSAFYLDRAGVPAIGDLPMKAKIVQHPELQVTNLNSAFVQPGGIGIYNRAWGRTSGYRVTDGQRRNVRMVTIRGGRVRETRRRLTNNRPIDGLVLIGRGQGARDLARLHQGSKATVGWRLQGTPQMAISGNKMLIDDGVIQVVDDRELHPRTAVGIDRDTGEVLLLVVDGRQASSRGATMVEMADLMIDLGADEALNLDGGGSSTMVARRPTGTVGVVNSPSDGSQRSVANALEVTYTKPG